ncbi:protein kinase C-binding protein NELL2 [Lingula anatina]|uniref:Protein kinase C-binding protein NELL2 n=1 Tax=Lingula anatina TaxID=7574 RepID=A0A1S3IDB9_LINAN|nr:protein kinase C-binding protein NELL2 [Lingula anatina]|eukprot:XP_013395434.2 protein kinase C-binding protein NELL2 [Lingula anatina]
MNNTDGPGLIPAQGFLSSPAYLFQDSHRSVQLDSIPLEKSLKPLVLQGNMEITILAVVKQKIGNVGSIVTLCSGQKRIFELQSSGRKGEIRLRYLHNNNTVHIETFPYQLADNKWHKVAIAVSSNEVTVRIDCINTFQRLIPTIDWTLNKDKLKVWIGQRRRKHAEFKGILQDVKIVSGPYGYLVQCPEADTACPTCGQFAKLEEMVQNLYNHIELLNAKLISTEKRLSALEACDCSKSCTFEGKKYEAGAEWDVNCTTCKCQNGKVDCRPLPCPATNCKHTVLQGCCPVCLKGCKFLNVSYDHNETTCPGKNKHYVCKNGIMKRNRHGKCPELDCPEENQVYVAKSCCKICKDSNYCKKGNNCHGNATCINLKTRYDCKCNAGFVGDGRHCEDVNECLKKGGQDGNHCDSDSTICANVPGSYVCQCKAGFTRVNEYNCIDINECDSGLHGCHDNAVCKNSIGSHTCECLPGYSGDGYLCTPICSIPCGNNGTCVKPDQCQCRPGYGGHDCQQDLDECVLGIANCPSSSECVNLPGRYYCKCKEGYKTIHGHSKDGDFCQDLNECEGEGGGHTCHPNALCINTLGGYYCNCSENSVSKCNNSCMYKDVEYASGTMWKADDERCSMCSCKEGVVRCNIVDCDCNSNYVDRDCCPQCDVNYQCIDLDMGRNYTNGQRWFEGCEECECLHGEIDCWPVKCPPLPCQQAQQSKEDCCPKCLDDKNSDNRVIQDPCADVGEVPLWNSVCTYNGLTYQHGDIFWLADDPCVSCECKAGQTCCSFNGSCNSGSTTEPENKSNMKGDISEKLLTDKDLVVQVGKEKRIKNSTISQEEGTDRRINVFSI